MDKKELAYLGIGKLRMRFQNKINSDEYYLSYSGGLDSHLLYWFIKEILKDNSIKIVSVNTYREHNEIRERMYDYSDKVLYPIMKMDQIKKKYGIPCFTKTQDEYIERYQGGCRSISLMKRVTGEGMIKFKLNKKARQMTLEGTIHKVSNKCCKFTKKEPLHKYEKETGLKPIVAVRTAESMQRKTAYSTCLSTKGKFTPIFDFTDEMVNAIYEVYEIQKPKVYDVLDRTGCVGCPYGLHGKNTAKELNMVTTAQRKYAIDSFGESYKVLGLNLD